MAFTWPYYVNPKCLSEHPDAKNGGGSFAHGPEECTLEADSKVLSDLNIAHEIKHGAHSLRLEAGTPEIAAQLRALGYNVQEPLKG